MKLNPLKLFYLFNFIIGLSLFSPIAILYYTQISNSYTLGASIFGVIMLMTAIFEVPTGIWSDKVGRRTTIIMGSFFRFCSYILYAVGSSYSWLFFGAVLEGLSRSLYSGNNNALLYDYLRDKNQEDQYDSYLGKASSYEQLALGISAFTVGFVLYASNYHWLLWLSAFFQFLLLIVSTLLSEPNSYQPSSTHPYQHLISAIKLFLSNSRLRTLSLLSIINFGINEMMYQFRASFTILVWPVWAVGIPSILSNFGASLSYYLSGGILKRILPTKLLLYKAIINKISAVIAYGFPSYLSPILLSSQSLLYGVGSVANSKLKNQIYTNHQRATMSSLDSLGGSILFAIISVLLGGIADYKDPAFALLVFTLISLPVLLLFKHLDNLYSAKP